MTENFAYGEINERCFIIPTPELQHSYGPNQQKRIDGAYAFIEINDRDFKVFGISGLDLYRNHNL